MQTSEWGLVMTIYFYAKDYQNTHGVHLEGFELEIGSIAEHHHLQVLWESTLLKPLQQTEFCRSQACSFMHEWISRLSLAQMYSDISR